MRKRWHVREGLGNRTFESAILQLQRVPWVRFRLLRARENGSRASLFCYKTLDIWSHLRRDRLMRWKLEERAASATLLNQWAFLWMPVECQLTPSSLTWLPRPQPTRNISSIHLSRNTFSKYLVEWSSTTPVMRRSTKQHVNTSPHAPGNISMDFWVL